MSFADKRYLVTGASRGIGRAVALGLGARGATIAVHYAHNASAAAEVVAEITAQGAQAFPVRADLAEVGAPTQIISQVGATLTKAGREAALDGIVLNAGELFVGDIEQITPDEFDRALAVNARAPLFLIQAALPLLRREARIVTVSAAITRWTNPTLLAQSAAKAALQNLSRNLAATLGPLGIGVVDVAPGVVQTDLAAPWLADSEYSQHVAADTALGRPSEPDDVADAIIALFSPETRWITGETIAVSGGYRL